MVITPSRCLVLFIACVVLGIGRAIATAPSIGVCYAVQPDTQTVSTTYLDGGALYYPGPSDADIEQREDGFVVTHRTLFRPIGHRVYLPVVSQ